MLGRVKDMIQPVIFLARFFHGGRGRGN